MLNYLVYISKRKCISVDDKIKTSEQVDEIINLSTILKNRKVILSNQSIKCRWV